MDNLVPFSKLAPRRCFAAPEGVAGARGLFFALGLLLAAPGCGDRGSPGPGDALPDERSADPAPRECTLVLEPGGRAAVEADAATASVAWGGLSGVGEPPGSSPLAGVPRGVQVAVGYEVDCGGPDGGWTDDADPSDGDAFLGHADAEAEADTEAEVAEADAQAERAWRDEVGPGAPLPRPVAGTTTDARDAGDLAAGAIDWSEREAEGQAVDELEAEARPVDEGSAQARSVDELTAQAQDVDGLVAPGVPVEARGPGLGLDDDEAGPDGGPRRTWRREQAGPRFFDNVDHRQKPRFLACVGASAYFSALARRYDAVGRCSFEESKHARRQYGDKTSALCEAPSFVGCRYQNGVERFFYRYTRVLLRSKRSGATKEARRGRAEAHRRDAATEASR